MKIRSCSTTCDDPRRSGCGYLLFNCMDKSDYIFKEYPPSHPLDHPRPQVRRTCGMNKGTGLASSLLPREVASEEDFGQFAPEDILKGQNFLEPRQAGWFPRDCGWCPPQREPTDSRGSPQPQGPLRLEQLHHCSRHHAAWFVRLKIRYIE